MKYIISSLVMILLLSACGGDEPDATCTDGILNGQEVSIDCGGPDCEPCVTCFDGIQNGGEIGVDCGGPDCPACSTCNDGIQNGDETGVDCGGTLCPPCPVLGCTDIAAHNYYSAATQDDGSCETCTDGIRNGDETGIDCGGILCGSCDVPGCTDPDAHNYDPAATTDDGSCETCFDGIQNGDEVGVDCGGVRCQQCYAVGQAGPAGGVVFYDRGGYQDGWRYLEVGVDIQGSDGFWGCFPFNIGGTSLALGSGYQNTQSIIAYHNLNGCSPAPTAAQVCDVLFVGAYDDWYLPSVNELKEMFPIKNQLGLTSGRYWSSTESNAQDAYVVDFAASDVNLSSYTWYKIPFNGQQGTARIKPIRRF